MRLPVPQPLSKIRDGLALDGKSLSIFLDHHFWYAREYHVLYLLSS